MTNRQNQKKFKNSFDEDSQTNDSQLNLHINKKTSLLS